MSAHSTPLFYDDLDASYEESWRLLVRGKNDRRSAFHTPAIATIGADGVPQVRTVVLRGADQAQAQLRFHTDIRAGKVAEIGAEPKIGLHFYDKKSKIQLRVSGTAHCHTEGALKDHAWDGSKPMSRECYRVNHSPGSHVMAPDAWSIPQDPSDPDEGKENFVAVMVTIETMEWLYLARGGHRRAKFFVAADGALAKATWLVP